MWFLRGTLFLRKNGMDATAFSAEQNTYPPEVCLLMHIIWQVRSFRPCSSQTMYT